MIDLQPLLGRTRPTPPQSNIGLTHSNSEIVLVILITRNESSCADTSTMTLLFIAEITGRRNIKHQIPKEHIRYNNLDRNDGSASIPSSHGRVSQR